MPPLSLRSLPPARGIDLELALLPPGPENVIDLGRDSVPVGIVNTGGHPHDMRHVRFGEPETVNQLRGAKPVYVSRPDFDGDGDADWLLWFRTAKTGLSTDDDQARLLMYDEQGVPLAGQAEVDVVS